MEQAVKTEQGASSFTKKIGQTTFKVNVYFAENTTATFEDKLLHLMDSDFATSRFSTEKAATETSEGTGTKNPYITAPSR